MKKVLSLVLALVMVLGSFSFVAAADFSDVNGTNNGEAITRLSQLNLLKGYPDGTFKPENQITRAEFATVMVRAKGLEAVAETTKGLPTGFNDVAGFHWASGYVGTASKAGIVNGIGNGLFAPEAPVKYEDAITMVVRALGYEASAQTKGGYPYGYLIVASELDLLDGARGTQGLPANRGFVAQITDNALEVPMMVQVGFGSDAKWVVSGSKEHGDNAQERYLLDEMGFDSIKGRVVNYNDSRKTITIDGDDKGTYDVAKGFDFYEVEGVLIKAWVDGDEVIVHKLEEEVLFDAVKYVSKDKEIELITADESYEVANKATFTIDGDKVNADKFEADYAKVVLNEDNEIVWAEGFTFDGFIVVEDVKKEVITSFNDDELDVEDFLIVKEGKTIEAEDLEKQDIVFYNEGEEFAVVYNNSEVGEIERVYTDSFRFEGETYNNKTEYADALYLDEDDMDVLTSDILDGMMDEKEEVEVFFDFAGEAVLVVGDSGVAKTNDAYAVLTKAPVKYDGRRGQMLALDVLNAAGEKMSYDLEEEFFTDGDFLINGVAVTTRDAVFAGLNAKDLLEITTDEDGDVTQIALLATIALTKEFEIDDTYAKAGSDYRLQSSTVVFYDLNDSGEYKEVVTLGEAKDKFSEVEKGFIYTSKGRVEVVLATATDADTDDTDYTGLVTKVRTLRDGKAEFTIKVAGKEFRYVTEEKANVDAKKFEDKIVTLTVGDTSGEIKKDGYQTVPGKEVTIDKINATDKTINDEYELTSNAVIYDKDFDEIKIRDLAKDDVVTVYTDGNSNRFVNYVLVGAKAPKAGDTEGQITYINKTSEPYSFAVDGKTPYFVNAKTILTDKDGVVKAMGAKEVVEYAGLVDAQVEVTFSGDVMTVKILKTKAELDAAAAQDAVTKAEGTKLQADVDAAQTLVTALPAGAVKTALQGRLTVVQQAIVDAVAAGITAPTAATDGSTAAGTVVLPTVPAGYTIVVKTTDDVTFYDLDGKIVADGTANVVFTVTHTASTLKADTAAIAIVVDVQ